MDKRLKEDLALLHLAGISNRTMALISKRILGVEVSAQTVRNIFRICRVHSDGLRHIAFSDMVACNVSIKKIRRLAGHSKLTTTQKYLKTNVRHLYEALATAS